MKTSVLFFICCISSLFAFSQHEINGKVFNEQDQALEFANIILYQLPDSSFVDGVTTDIKGEFKFATVNDGEFFIKAMVLGYQEYYSDLIQINENVDHKYIEFQLNEAISDLEEIEIIAKKPMIVQEPDKMVVNVSDHITGGDGNLLDVLKKVPGMLVVNDRISLAGNSNPTILIDGRSTKYMDIQALLKEMPADNIDKIEVISQPGAEYDASGVGPIINVILKKNKLYGTNGSIRYNTSKGIGWRNGLSFSLNNKNGKLNSYINAGVGDRYYYESLILGRLLEQDIYYQQNVSPSVPQTGRLSGGMDYYIDKEQTIGFSINAIASKNNRDNNTKTIIDWKDQDVNTVLNSINSITSTWKMLSSSLYYTYDIDTAGQKLEIDYSNAFYDRSYNTKISSVIEQNAFFEINNIKNQRPGNTQFHTIQTDYTLPLSKNIKINTGAKYSIVSINNDLKSQINVNGVWVNDASQSNNFLLDEDIKAAYVKSNLKIDQWIISAGIRYEDSNTEGLSVTLDSTTNRRIKKFFPSISIGKTLTKQLDIALSYSYRIKRPRYSSLNPFIYYMDPFTIQRGNPFLRPELSHSSRLSLSFEKQPFFNIEYIKTNDAITLITEQNKSTGISAAFDDNIEDYTRLGASLFFPLDFLKVISGYGGFMFYQNEFSNSFDGELYNQKANTFTTFLQAKFKLPLDINAEVSGWYNNGGQDGIMRFEHMYGASFGLERKFLNDKLVVKTGINDFVNRFFIADINYGTTLGNLMSTWDSKVIYLSVNFKFGNKFLSERKLRSSKSRDLLNRAKED